MESEATEAKVVGKKRGPRKEDTGDAATPKKKAGRPKKNHVEVKKMVKKPSLEKSDKNFVVNGQKIKRQKNTVEMSSENKQHSADTRDDAPGNESKKNHTKTGNTDQADKYTDKMNNKVKKTNAPKMGSSTTGGISDVASNGEEKSKTTKRKKCKVEGSSICTEKEDSKPVKLELLPQCNTSQSGGDDGSSGNRNNPVLPVKDKLTTTVDDLKSSGDDVKEGVRCEIADNKDKSNEDSTIETISAEHEGNSQSSELTESDITSTVVDRTQERRELNANPNKAAEEGSRTVTNLNRVVVESSTNESGSGSIQGDVNAAVPDGGLPGSDDDRQFACTHCSYRAKRRVQLRRHLGTHGVHECAHCDFVSDNKAQLHAHLQQSHPARCDRKRCTRCRRMIPEAVLAEHADTCTGEVRPWACVLCRREFPYECQLRTHERVHEVGKGTAIDECNSDGAHSVNAPLAVDEMISNESPMSTMPMDLTAGTALPMMISPSPDNTLTDSEPQPVVSCGVCAQTFSTGTLLQAHAVMHTRPSAFVCDFAGCNEAFAKRMLLVLHKQQAHGVVRQFVCEHPGCSLRFSKRSQLTRHGIVHTDTRNFVCEWPGCGKAFRHSDNLKVHFRRHSREHAIRCDLCSFTCQQQTVLKSHMKMQHGASGITTTSTMVETLSTQLAELAGVMEQEGDVGEPSRIEVANDRVPLVNLVDTAPTPAVEMASATIAMQADNIQDSNIIVGPIQPIETGATTHTHAVDMIVTSPVQAVELVAVTPIQTIDTAPDQAAETPALSTPAVPAPDIYDFNDDEEDTQSLLVTRSKAAGRSPGQSSLENSSDAGRTTRTDDVSTSDTASSFDTASGTAGKGKTNQKTVGKSTRPDVQPKKPRKKRTPKATIAEMADSDVPAKTPILKTSVGTENKSLGKNKNGVTRKKSRNEKTSEVSLKRRSSEDARGDSPKKTCHEVDSLEGKSSPLKKTEDKKNESYQSETMKDVEEHQGDVSEVSEMYLLAEEVRSRTIAEIERDNALATNSEHPEDMITPDCVDRPSTPAEADWPLPTDLRDAVVGAEQAINYHKEPPVDGTTTDVPLLNDYDATMLNVTDSKLLETSVSNIMTEKDVDELSLPSIPNGSPNMSVHSDFGADVVMSPGAFKESAELCSTTEPFSISTDDAAAVMQVALERPASPELPDDAATVYGVGVPVITSQPKLDQMSDKSAPFPDATKAGYGPELFNDVASQGYNVAAHSRPGSVLSQQAEVSHHSYPPSNGPYTPYMPGSMERQTVLTPNPAVMPTDYSPSHASFPAPPVSQPLYGCGGPMQMTGGVAAYSPSPRSPFLLDPLAGKTHEPIHTASVNAPTYAFGRDPAPDFSAVGKGLPPTACFPAPEGFPPKDFFPYFGQDPSTLPLSHLPAQQDQRLSYPQRTAFDMFPRPSMLPTPAYAGDSLAGITPGMVPQAWGLDDRVRPAWPQHSSLVGPAASQLGRAAFNRDFGFDPATSRGLKHADAPFAIPQPTDPYNSMSYMARPFTPAVSYARPPTGSSQKHLEGAYRHPDYRTLPSTADLYGRMTVTPAALGLDKFYYQRESMYRPPFMPPASTPQYTDYTRAAPVAYAQHSAAAAAAAAYGLMGDKPYLASSKMADMTPSLAERTAASDYLQQLPPGADIQDPYHRSVIYNMMSRYY